MPDVFSSARGAVFMKAAQGSGRRLWIGKQSINCLNMKVGDNVAIGSYCGFEPGVEIGNNVRIGHEVQIITNSCVNKGAGKIVRIGDNVIIGRRAMIMPFVSIGHDSIVGAGAVVPKDVPPYSLAVGNPCIIIKGKYRKARPTKENHNGVYRLRE